MPYQLTRKSWVFFPSAFSCALLTRLPEAFPTKKNTGAVLLTDPRAGMARNFRHSFTFDHFSPRKTGNAERGTERHEGAKPGGEVGTDEAVQRCLAHLTIPSGAFCLFYFCQRLFITADYSILFLSIKKATMLNPHHVVRRKNKKS